MRTDDAGQGADRARHGGRRASVVGAIAVLVAALAPVAGHRALADPGETPVDYCSPVVVTTTGGRWESPQSVIQVADGANFSALCRYQQAVLKRYVEASGRTYTRQEQARLLTWGRSEARAAIFDDLVRLSKVASPDADERAAVEWFTRRIRTTRYDAAVTARAEYSKWKTNPCGYVPPVGTYDTSGHCDVSTLVSLFVGPPDPPTHGDFIHYGVVKALARLTSGAGAQTVFGTAIENSTVAVALAIGSGVLLGLGAYAMTILATSAAVTLYFALDAATITVVSRRPSPSHRWSPD